MTHKANNRDAIYTCSYHFNKFYVDFDRCYQDLLVSKQTPAAKAQTLIYYAEIAKASILEADLEAGTFGTRLRRSISS